MLGWLEHIVFVIVVLILLHIWLSKGREEVLKTIMQALLKLPGVKILLDMAFHSEAAKMVRQTKSDSETQKRTTRVALPEKGQTADELRKELARMREVEVEHEKGVIFSYVYTMSNEQFKLQQDMWDMWEEKVGISEEHDKISHEFLCAFLHENALNPMIYPSLRRMEIEIISMTAAMLNGSDHVGGFLTSGGTESILMAVKTYRDRARALYPQINKPNIVAPTTIHPAMEKAAHYFNVEIRHAPVDMYYRAIPEAMEQLIDGDTIMLAASAPQYAHGVVDPIEEIAKIAETKGIPLHIDSCFGGFMLPWVEKLGYPVPKFDFRNPGVTSISADAHKWGYCCKGSSLILYRNDDYRKYQIFSYTEWCGGLYASPSMAGSRPGGNIASTWATMRYLGVEGYTRIAKDLMDTRNAIMERLCNIKGLFIVGTPHMNSIAVSSNDKDMNIMAVADFMEEAGFKMERQLNPACLHMSIMPHHIKTVDVVIQGFENACREVREKKALPKEGMAAMYGMMGVIPDKTVLKDFLVEFFCQIYK